MTNKIITFKNLEKYHDEISQIIDSKQDVISDLETIRTGAAAGATALQAQSLNDYYTKEQIDNMLGVAIEKTNTILNA